MYGNRKGKSNQEKRSASLIGRSGQAFFNRDHFPEEKFPMDVLKRKPVPSPACSKGILSTSAQGHMLPQNYSNDKTVHPRFQILWYATRFYAESSCRLSKIFANINCGRALCLRRGREL
jgi:hypothetical protein